MSQFATTFRTRALTYVEATEQHTTVSEATKQFVSGNAARAHHCIELWESLVNIRDEEDKNAISDCVDVTMPQEFIPMMRRSDSIAATFAFACILEEIRNASDLTDDLELKPLFHEAWRKFNQRRLEANNVEEGFGCGQDPSWHTLRDIYNVDDGEGQWKKRILEISKLAGKMYDLIKPVGKKVKSEDPMEVEGVKVGGDVEQLLPAELALLGQDETKDMQSMKVLKGEATQRKMTGVRTKGRGPIVILIDESGSMHDFGWGHHGGKRGRNTWAKACAIALIRVAWSEGRPATVVHFGNGCVVQDIPKDDSQALFEMARSFMSGGTVFSTALSTGIKEVADLEKRGYKGADIVLITDGDEYDHSAHDAQIDIMDKAGIDLWSVAIGLAFNTDAPVRKRAKMYVEVRDSILGSDQAATEIVDGLQEAAMDNPED
jgi:hypothetical protein